MIRAIQLTLAGMVIAVAALAVVGMTRLPEAGVTPELPGGRVLYVDPGGPAWRGGVRVGDRVLALDSSEMASGWRLVTSDGAITRKTEATSYVEVHRSNAGLAILGLAVSLVSAVIAYRGMPLSATVLPIAFGLAAQPLFFAGSVVATLVGGVAVFGAGGLAGLAFLPAPAVSSPGARHRRRLLTLGMASLGGVLSVGWILAVVVAPALFDPLDALRWPVAIAFAAISAFILVGRTRPRQALLGDRAPTFVDLIYGAIVGAVLLGLLIARVDALIVVVLGVVAIAAYPYGRRLSLGAFDRLVTADARRDAAIRAVEDERGRLAREIHDAPLQDLAGVIRQLDGVPAAATAAATLRGVAARLRDVASTLHPPVLEDLGLAAAVEDLAELQLSASPSLAITVAVDDLTREGAPPDDVAIAAYRVAQEALANAVAHSGAARVTVDGVVAADTVLLQVVDDGAGFGTDAIRAARSAGHFGLDSMRERGRAVGADVTAISTPDGTTVTFQWQARR